jgi:site-specific DNA-methyltransferase (adenine-specific)
VPTQAWSRNWTDADLYAKYGLTASEIAFIEKIVRPMDLSGDVPDEAGSDDDE